MEICGISAVLKNKSFWWTWQSTIYSTSQCYTVTSCTALIHVTALWGSIRKYMRWLISLSFIFCFRSVSRFLRKPHERCFSSAISSKPSSVRAPRHFRSRAWRHSTGSHVSAAGSSGVHDVAAAPVLPSRLPSQQRIDSTQRIARSNEVQWRLKKFRQILATFYDRKSFVVRHSHARCACVNIKKPPFIAKDSPSCKKCKSTHLVKYQ